MNKLLIGAVIGNIFIILIIIIVVYRSTLNSCNDQEPNNSSITHTDSGARKKHTHNGTHEFNKDHHRTSGFNNRNRKGWGWIHNNRDTLYIEQQDSNKRTVFEHSYIKEPKNGFDYSMCFFIYNNDYTNNFEYWKHVLHKGSNVDYNHKTNNWSNLIERNDRTYQDQNPGIWMNPTNTKMRLAFSTQQNYNYASSTNHIDSINQSGVVSCISYKEEHKCPTDTCKWYNGKCIWSNENAIMFGHSGNGKQEINTKYNIEYVDIDIPFKKVTHIGFVLEHQVLNVYYNGKLRKIHKFKGELVPNKGLMYFNYHTTYDGSLFNFNYIPYAIEPSKMYEYSKDLPNIKHIPKKERFNNYIKRFKILDASKSFFI